MKKLLYICLASAFVSNVWGASGRPEDEKAHADVLSIEAQQYRQAVEPEIVQALNVAMRFRHGKILNIEKSSLNAYRQHAIALGDHEVASWINKIINTFPTDIDKFKIGVSSYAFETDIKPFLRDNGFPEASLKQLPNYENAVLIIENLKEILHASIRPGQNVSALTPEAAARLSAARTMASESGLQSLIPLIDNVIELLQSNIDYETYNQYGKPELIKHGFPKHYLP